MESKPQKMTVGVLGGMGPYATALFYQNLLELTPAKKDWDHLRVIIDSNPHIPSRSRAVLYNEESPVEGMIGSCRRLAAWPADFIVIPCNSACYFLPEVRKQIKTPILDIREAACDEIKNKYPGLKRIAVLGGAVTYLKETYKDCLEKRDLQLVRHDQKTQARVEELIERTKQWQEKTSLTEAYQSLIKEILKASSPDGFILACTEFSLFKDINAGIPVIDSSFALARWTVEIGLGQSAIPLDSEGIFSFWKGRAGLLQKGEFSETQAILLTADEEGAVSRDKVEKEKLTAFIQRHQPRFKGRLADFGCGVGRLTEFLAPHFEHVDAMDFCEEFIEQARSNAARKSIKNIHYSAGRSEDFKPKALYDVCFVAGMILFLDDPQWARLVSVIASCLKKKGICLIRESMGIEKRFELHQFYSSVLQQSYSAIYRTSREMTDEFAKHGMRLIDEEVTIPPAQGKPETCQKILVFEKN